MIVINPLIILNISFVKTKFKICPFERIKIIVNGRSEMKLIEWVIRNKMIIFGLQNLNYRHSVFFVTLIINMSKPALFKNLSFLHSPYHRGINRACKCCKYSSGLAQINAIIMGFVGFKCPDFLFSILRVPIFPSKRQFKSLNVL